MGQSSLTASESFRLLVVDRRGWIARTLGSVLAPAEWTVAHAAGGTEARAMLGRTRPHIVLVHDDLTDVDVPTLCTELRRDPAVGALTPIIVVSTRPLREHRLAALRAGATHFTVFPPDSETFLLELRALAVARREAERLEQAALIDARTGLYTQPGIAVRSREIANEARRRHDPLTCVAITAPRERPLAMTALLDDAIAQARRRSDVVGRLEDALVVIAPATGGSGAGQMTERLRGVLESAVGDERPGAHVRAAFCTVSDFARSTLSIEQMLDRAISVLVASESGETAAPPIVGEFVPLSNE